MAGIKYLLQLPVLLLLSSLSVYGSTIIPGGNIGNQTWIVANSPYIVQGDITITSGSNLLIEPGVIIKFSTTDSQSGGIDMNKCELRIQDGGSLIGQGTTGSHITFTSNSGSPQPGDWYGIVVLSGGVCNLDYCNMEYCLVNVIPEAAGVITGPASVCKETNELIYSVPSVTGATSYLWTLPSGITGNSTTNNITVSIGTDAVSGSITVKGHNSCGNGFESSYSVTVKEIPQTPVITLDNDILLSSASSGNQWYLNNGIITDAVNNTFTPLASGDYYVIVTNNDCSSAPSNTISYVSTGINRTESKDEFFVSPNPASDIIRIEIPSVVNSDYWIGIYDQDGILVQRYYIAKNNYSVELDISDYHPGIYIITIQALYIKYHVKFIKN